MAGHFQTLLQELVANPNQRLSDIPLLSADERHQLLVEWNSTEADYPQSVCIHQLFEATVERTPDAVALVFEDQQLTYQELNARANQLAHHLQTLGVEPDVLVGICVERSVEMVVGLLGILKAGGAYVPLDPAYPQQRLAFMLEDALVPVLLTEARLLERLPNHQAKLVCLDTNWEANAYSCAKQYAQHNPKSCHTADNLAYAIYTSGSTGKPKAVAVPHRAVSRLLFNTNYINLEPLDVVAFVSNCAFDAATFEIWGALLHGARLVGFTRDVALSPQDFTAQLRQQEISVLFLTSALFNHLALEIPSAFNSVRCLLVGGETVEPKSVKQMLENGLPGSLLNVYGPTESTTFASWYKVLEVPTGVTNIPIGRPLSNTQIYLLDAQLQPVPVGVSGELYIGGAGLARDYLNRPDLTALAFIPNPFTNQPGTRLYKTGDLARYLPDGNIEFLGRSDQQVKIRGFRIEVGEIEAVLSQHPAVLQTVVIAREHVSGDRRLVAYLVPKQESAPTIIDLRSFLKEQLPEYMMPSAFVLLDTLPLTPNGKVDCRALPAPDTSQTSLEIGFVPPRTPFEQSLAAIWAEVLGLKQVGIHNNFFELGGDSILSIQVIARANQAGLELTPKQLFQHQTIAELAAVAGTTISVKAEQGLVTGYFTPIDFLLAKLDEHKLNQLSILLDQMNLENVEDIYPLSPRQQEYLLDQLQYPQSGFGFEQINFTLDGNLDLGAFKQAWQQVVTQHPILRTAFFWQGLDEPLQVVCQHLSLPWKHYDWQGLTATDKEEHLLALIQSEREQGFEFTQAPLVGCALIKLGEDTYQFILSFHHILLDGWSINLILKEVIAFYEALSKGNDLYLEPLPPYRDYIVWLQQQDYSRSEALWCQALQGLTTPAPTPLVIDSAVANQDNQKGTYDKQAVYLSTTLTKAVQSLGRQHHLTMSTLVQGAWALLLSLYSGQEDIFFRSIVSGRSGALPGVESMVGLLVNALPMRVQVSKEAVVLPWLSQFQAQQVEQQEQYSYTPPVKIQQWSNLLQEMPLFESTVVFQNTPVDASLLLPSSSLQISNMRMFRGANRNLSLLAVPGEQLSLEIYYTNRFDVATISRMLSHLQTLLEGIVANPVQSVSDCFLLCTW
jgi:amino acid adenylation domain-containing protein